MDIINIKGLYKTFGKIEAVRHIDLAIREGEFFGMLGPNGAGKTTTINILSTVLKADAGEVWIDGYDLKKDAARCKKAIGIVPQELALYDELTAKENLMFWGGLYQIPSREAAQRAESLLKLFELYDRRNSLIKTFSGGMKRRINIAAAMLHRPRILLMDEPTVGVDPQSRHQIYDVLADFSKQGITIVYTTHYMDEVERLCNRIGIIDHGEMLAIGSLDDLRKLSGSHQSIVIYFNEKNEAEFLKMKKEFGDKVHIFDDRVVMDSDNVSEDLPLLIQKCTASCHSLKHISLKHASLESVFLKLTGHQLREN